MKEIPGIKNIIFSGILLLVCCGCLPVGVQAQNTAIKNSSYANPVLNFVFADPAVIKAPDGWFYAYATRTWHEEKEMINLQIAKSKDMVHWQYLPDGMPVKPSWLTVLPNFGHRIFTKPETE